MTQPDLPTLTSSSNRRAVITLTFLFIALLAVAAARLLMVGEPTPRLPDGQIDHDTLNQYLAIRTDRILIAAITGASLAISGVILQALLRNPLASPYILGVSSGAALGVMLAWTGALAILGIAATHSAALTGAALTMLAVYLLAQKRGRIDPVGLLLVGVIINAINAAAIMFIHFINPDGPRSDILQWMMGYLNTGVSSNTILTIGLTTAACITITFLNARAIDASAFTDTEAFSMGVNLNRLRITLFAIAGILTAGSVMLAGPIGFVGLICPHFSRLLVGPTHKSLVIASALMGATLLILADTIIRLTADITNSGLMPIGILTALIGGPAFIFMLRPHLGRGDDG